MTRVGWRQKSLFLGLGMSAAVWIGDWISHERPAAAKASGALPPPAHAPPDWSDATRVLSRLSSEGLGGGGGLEALSRNPFAMTDKMLESLRAAASTQAAGLRALQAPSAAAVEAPLRLRAVIAGRAPLALIDDVLCSEGASVRGYVVLSIARDRVWLQGSDDTLELRLETPFERGRPEVGPD